MLNYNLLDAVDNLGKDREEYVVLEEIRKESSNF